MTDEPSNQPRTMQTWRTLWRFFGQQWATVCGAVAFYTCLPIPAAIALEFRGIAAWAPIVGVGAGAVLGGLDLGLTLLGLSPLLRSALVVVIWLGLTGGLHLDGAMDTADGLAVLDPQRRLDVMADSRTGAFGVMAAVCILLLKTVALTELSSDRPILLMAVLGWGRWGQLLAIARYPYLRPGGKGALHKESIRSGWAALPSGLFLLGISSLVHSQTPGWLAILVMTGGGVLIATLAGAWFNRCLGGQTGDTYGAIVEWTEALLLCWLAILLHQPLFR